MLDKVIPIAGAIAGATSLAILTIPLFWHSKTVERPSHIIQWLWPEEALVQPTILPNTIQSPETWATSTSPRRVKTETYTALIIVPKVTEPPKSTEPPTAGRGASEGRGAGERASRADICQLSGGRRITVHRGWRCIYPHYRHRHRHKWS